MSLSKYSKKVWIPDVGSKPHQPLVNFKFPYREFGKQKLVKRAFQHSWFAKWKWLHYEEDMDKAFCYNCIQAYKEDKLRASNLELAFISKGFNNWKDASVKFKEHESSNCHKDSMIVTVDLPSSVKDIAETLQRELTKQKSENRQMLLKILSNIRFLARQSIAIRGDGDEENSNFIQLFKLRGEDDPKFAKWLEKKTDKYVSADIQNELLKVMGLQVLRDIATSLHSAEFYSIMVDETTDVSNKEQAVLCFRWVSDDLIAHEDFVGLYGIENTEAKTLVNMILDVLTRLNLSIKKLRGQCYDGASAMSGPRSGVAKQIRDLESRAVYTHCYGHSLNLACMDTIKSSKVMQEALDITAEITKLVKLSPRRGTIFQRLKDELAPLDPGIRVLCPTRWTVKAEAQKSIVDNFEVLQHLWEESLEYVKESEMRARILGVSDRMMKFDFFFGAILGETVLSHSDNLSRTLQKGDISASEGQGVVEMTVTCLKTLRTDDNFALFWSKVTKKATQLNIDEPALPRKRKRTVRYESGNAAPEFHTSIEGYYRQAYFEVLDVICSTIEDRFRQPGYQLYSNLEQLLLKAVCKENYSSEFDFVTKFYGPDLNVHALEMQLQIFATNFIMEGKKTSIKDILKYLRNISSAQRALLSEICIIAKLILVMPATNAVSERSFSALRRVKTYLRSTMKQTRLNHLMILHVHKDITDSLNLNDIGNEFVRCSEHRLSVFGHF